MGVDVMSAVAAAPRQRAPAGARKAAVAVAAGLLGLLALVRYGVGGHGAVAAFVSAVLVVLSAIDIERRILPNRIVLPSAAVVLCAQTALFPDRAGEWALAAAGAAIALFLPLLLHPGGMGMGDVKLGLLLGAALGQGVVVAIPLGFIAAVPFALFLLVRGGAAARKQTIPFGPFLAFGSLVVLFLGVDG